MSSNNTLVENLKRLGIRRADLPIKLSTEAAFRNSKENLWWK